MSTNITKYEIETAPFASHKNHICMVIGMTLTNNYVENKTETAPFISHMHTHIISIWLEITSTNITLKTNPNGPIFKSILRILRWIQASPVYGYK